MRVDTYLREAHQFYYKEVKLVIAVETDVIMHMGN
jgi:hypothetical protein